MSKPSVRKLMRGAAVLAVSALLAVPAMAQEIHLRLGYVPVASFAPLFVLADRYLPELGVKVEMVRLSSGPAVHALVKDGKLEIGGSGMGSVGFNSTAANDPVEWVAPKLTAYMEEYFAVRKASWGNQIKRIADLKGKSVALAGRGSSVEWMLDQVLRRDGLTIADVDVKIMSFPLMEAALAKGEVEAAIMSEPHPTLAEERGVALRPLSRTADSKLIPLTGIIWNRDWAKKNPELAHKVMLAYVKAARDLNRDGGWKAERNIALIAKYTGADVSVQRRTRAELVLDANLDIDLSVLDSIQHMGMRLGALKYKELMQPELLFNLSYRDKAVKELGRLGAERK